MADPDLRGGRALFDLCVKRPEPIPFFGELGSVNPMFLLPGALAGAGAETLGSGWAASLTAGAGQFCHDLVVDDDVLFDFYDERIPADIVSGAHFDRWWKNERRKNPSLLTFTEDLLVADDADAVDEQFHAVRAGDADVLLVQINPIEHPDLPDTAPEIMERMNEVTFNASLLGELRAIDFVRRLLAEGKLDPKRYKNVLLHRIDGGAALSELGATSKARSDLSFILRLFEQGRVQGQRWLHTHFGDIGVRQTLQIVDHC